MSRSEEVKSRMVGSVLQRRLQLALFMLFVPFSFFVSGGSAQTQLASLSWPANLAAQIQSSEKTAEQAYKNIQVLRELRANELDGVMQFMSAALGVGCTHCHTNPWASDEKTAKVAARRMILMTRVINKDNFSGNPAVTCYTCHRGQHNSVPNPPPDIATSRLEDATIPLKPTALPSTDEIIDRYTRAIGGEAAIRKIKTRISRGTETTTNRMTPPQPTPLEIVETTANKLLTVRGASRASIEAGFDGTRGWNKDARGLHEMDGRQLTDLKEDADLMRYLSLRVSYPQMRVLAKESVGDRSAYVIGATSRDDSREKLYFDAETGFLIRKLVSFKTAFGTIPEVTEFEDYREVNGVKLPFTITWSRPPFGSVRKFTEIKLNVSVDDSRFTPRSK